MRDLYLPSLIQRIERFETALKNATEPTDPEEELEQEEGRLFTVLGVQNAVKEFEKNVIGEGLTRVKAKEEAKEAMQGLKELRDSFNKANTNGFPCQRDYYFFKLYRLIYQLEVICEEDLCRLVSEGLLDEAKKVQEEISLWLHVLG